MSPVLVLATAALAAIAAPDSAARAITLDEALALASRNATQIVSALGDRRNAAAGVRSAVAAFIPSLSFTAGDTRQLPAGGARTRIDANGQVITLPNEPWSYNAGLGASLQLFDGGNRFFALSQAHSRARVATAGETTQRFAVALAVKQSFYDVLAARESESAAAAQVDQARQQLRTSILRLLAHAVTRSDSLRSEIQLRQALLAVTTARAALAAASATLTRVVGLDEPITAAPDSGAAPALTVDAATLAALVEEGPAVTSAAAALDAARAARRSAWTTYLPAVSASYSRSGSGTGTTLLPPAGAFDYSGSLRLSLSFPIFDQLQREGRLIAAEVAEDDAAAELRDARLAARASLVQSLGDFRTAEERVASQTATLEAAGEDLRVQQQRYAVGGSTLLDVLTSQSQVDQARHDLIRARYDLRIAHAQLEALVGRKL
jgi:outer membrane protein